MLKCRIITSYLFWGVNLLLKWTSLNKKRKKYTTDFSFRVWFILVNRRWSHLFLLMFCGRFMLSRRDAALPIFIHEARRISELYLVLHLKGRCPPTDTDSLATNPDGLCFQLDSLPLTIQPAFRLITSHS